MSAVCKDCGADFPITEASRAKGMYLCAPCRKVRSRARYERRKAAGLPVSGCAMPTEYHRAYGTVYSQRPDVRQRRAAYSRDRRRNPVERPKVEARWLTRRAINSGKIVRGPCEVCGATKVDAHHDDYGQPLAVRWLCRAHHNEHHAKARGGQS